MTFDDYHAHTNLSYCCNTSLTLEDYRLALRRHGHLRTATITDHGFAIYFPKEMAWSWAFMLDPSIFDQHMRWGNERLLPHLDAIDAHRAEGLLAGIEVEMMKDGRLTFDPTLRPRLDVIIGSIHWLPVGRSAGSPWNEIMKVWRSHTQQLIGSGIDVLGHPLRWLSVQIDHVPADVIGWVVEEARRSGVAIEINQHYVLDTDAELLAEVARTRAPVTLVTDAHESDEIGRFDYHVGLLKDQGLTLDDLTLWKPSRRALP